MNDEKTTVELDYAPKRVRRLRTPFARRILTYVTIFGALALCQLIFTSYDIADSYLQCGRLVHRNVAVIGLLLVTVVGGVSSLRQLAKREVDQRPTIIIYAGFGSGVILCMLTFYGTCLDPIINENRRASELSKRTVCSANLRGIAQAADAYRLEHGTDYATLDSLVAEGSLTPKQLRCPSFDSNPNCYRRVKQCSPNKDGLVPIIIEDPRNHYCEGGNVLYDDGSVDFLRKPALAALIQSATFE